MATLPIESANAILKLLNMIRSKNRSDFFIPEIYSVPELGNVKIHHLLLIER